MSRYAIAIFAKCRTIAKKHKRYSSLFTLTVNDFCRNLALELGVMFHKTPRQAEKVYYYILRKLRKEMGEKRM